jgi:hypothetical protein
MSDDTLVITPAGDTEVILTDGDIVAILDDGSLLGLVGSIATATIEASEQEAILESMHGGGATSTLTTDDFNYHTILRVTISDGHAYNVRVVVVGTARNDTNRATYFIGGLFYGKTGAAHREGSDGSYMTTESEQNWDSRILVDGNTLEIQVNSYGSEVNWKAEKQVLEV